MRPDTEQSSLLTRIEIFLTWLIRFITYDIWRITENEMSGLKQLYINLIKTLILAVRAFIQDSLMRKASALTYSTLLSIIPMLAVLIGIAKGFGFQSAVRQELHDYFPGHETELDQAFVFVESYLDQAQGGVIIGVGLLLLLYTVINLLSSIEDTFNEIWQIQKSRPWRRKISDYLALFLLLPVLMTTSSGLSIFISTIQNSFMERYFFFTPVVETILHIVPYVITTLVFTALYVSLPNTKVHLVKGLAAGFVAGCAFQFFQYLYITGQIWVSKYNAIYGSFAVLPLLLMWLQLSWVICLFGAELSYASQNVKKFSFEQDSQHISRRYKDFLTLLIASLIVKRFAQGDEPPYTANELSETYRIPIRLTNQILHLLKEIKIITEVNYGNDDRVAYFHPAMDINRISVSFLFQQIDQYGSENFKIDTDKLFCKEWQLLLNLRQEAEIAGNSLLLKDL